MGPCLLAWCPYKLTAWMKMIFCHKQLAIRARPSHSGMVNFASWVREHYATIFFFFWCVNRNYMVRTDDTTVALPHIHSYCKFSTTITYCSHIVKYAHWWPNSWCEVNYTREGPRWLLGKRFYPEPISYDTGSVSCCAKLTTKWVCPTLARLNFRSLCMRTLTTDLKIGNQHDCLSKVSW